jgi:uncharacterized protein (DUF58 family)
MNEEYRELRPSSAAVGAGLLAAVTWTVWQDSGSRLSLFVCAATVAVAIIDVAWALTATKRLRLTITSNPAEAIVGDTVRAAVSFAGPRQFVTVSVPSLSSDAAGAGVDVPTTAHLSGITTAREVRHNLEIEVVSRGLAGLVACARRRIVPLARPLAVGPRPLPAAESFPELFRTWGEGQPRAALTGDLIRGVRPYVPGDPRRRVHWRATARVGDLVVKEVDELGAPRLLLGLDMGGGGAAGERAAGRAAWYALEALRRGYAVTLATSEFAGPERSPERRLVVGPAASQSDVIRRLAAAAAPGKLELGRDQPPGGVLVVSDRGDSWR